MDHLGFNFVKSSRRYVDPQQAKRLAERARGHCSTVGVFLNPTREEVQNVLEMVPLDILQLHGLETPDFCASLPLPVWKVFAVGPGWDVAAPASYVGVAARLYDTASKLGVSGGTGKAFDWSQLPGNPGHPWYLAGGLNPENLSEALEICKPDGIDLNSGVESSPGLKDPHKLAAAMAIVSAWRAKENVSTFPGRLVSNVEVDGRFWPCWKLDREVQSLDLETSGLLDLLEIHDYLVLDLTNREGDAVDLAHELMHWQMLAFERGRHLKFRVPEALLEVLLRSSLTPLLEIID